MYIINAMTVLCKIKYNVHDRSPEMFQTYRALGIYKRRLKAEIFQQDAQCGYDINCRSNHTVHLVA